jgi:hypothetical protein
MLTYRQSVLDSVSDTSSAYNRYTAVVSELTDGQFERLTDYTNIEEAMKSAGNSYQMAVTSFDVESAISVGGHILRGAVAWRLPPTEAVFSTSVGEYPYVGERLSKEAPYELMLGDGMLRGISHPESLIGEELLLFGETYSVCGIVRGSNNIEANILSRKIVPGVVLTFRSPIDSPANYASLATAVETNFSVTGVTELKVDEAYAFEAKRKTVWLLAAAFAAFAFCLLNSFGIINSFLYDCRRKVLIKMMVGARKSEVFLELMVFWAALLLASSILAFLAAFGAVDYMSRLFFFPVNVAWGTAVILPILGLGTALLVSLYSVWRIARWLA